MANDHDYVVAAHLYRAMNLQPRQARFKVGDKPSRRFSVTWAAVKALQWLVGAFS